VSEPSCPVSAGGLRGLRVLLVEDEMMLSMLVEDWLLDAGCVVVGPAANLDRALRLAGTETIDVAVLDVNLGGDVVWEAAELLATRGIPFVVTTGYAVADLDQRFRGSAAVQKPFRNAELVAALCAVRTAARADAAD
jgi:CheY-like chemotaxis protein